MYLQCVQGAYGEPAFEELDEIFYIVKLIIIFLNSLWLVNIFNVNKIIPLIK